jgi:tRNA(fMet)-specific endonuclease VapC
MMANLVSVLYDGRRPKHQTVRQTIAGLDPASPQLVSVITVRFGLALSEAAGRELSHIQATIERVDEHPLAEVGRYTAEAFAYVKSNLAIRYVDLNRRLPRWVEGRTDNVMSQMLQIDENDLWLAAQAVERNYVVLTCDQDFTNVLSPTIIVGSSRDGRGSIAGHLPPRPGQVFGRLRSAPVVKERRIRSASASAANRTGLARA